MKKKILFFPQNETHIANMLPVAKILKDQNNDVAFLNTNQFYQQNLQYASEYELVVLNNKKKLIKPFYAYHGFERLRKVFYLKKYIEPLAHDYDAFIFGNDGSLQRCLINEAKLLDKKCILILDGMISNYSFSLIDLASKSKNKLLDLKLYIKDRLKTQLQRVFKKSKINAYLPSIDGGSNLDLIFVIGEHSKQVVYSFTKNRNIYSYGLPRFASSTPKAKASSPNYQSKTVIFITSAFNWHNKHLENEWQRKDIALILEVIKEEKKRGQDIKLVIKIHPRENIDDYQKYQRYNFVIIENTATLNELFSSNAIFISNISTGIIEGIKAKVNVYSLMINFPYWKFKRSFIGNNEINKIFTKEQLRFIIKEYKNNKSHNPIKEKDLEYYMFSPDTSSYLIANEILKVLS